MKLLITTLALATFAFGYPHHQSFGDKPQLVRLDQFLHLLPDDLRQQYEEPIRTAVANGERPEIPDEVRDQIREHLSGLKQQDQNRLDRFLSMLPADLRQEVQAVLEKSAISGEFPRASEELRNKIRNHFEAVKEERKQRLDKFLSMLPEDLREEAEGLLLAPLDHAERPQAPEELREKIREHFSGLKEGHQKRLNQFISMLPEDLRHEVEVVLEQALANGERPQAPQELREKIRDHFGQLKEAHRDQMEQVLNYLPKELRDRIEEELGQFEQGHGVKPKFSQELIQTLREYLNRLLPGELRDQIFSEVQQAIQSGLYPVLSEDLREKIHKFMEQLWKPQV